MGGEARVGGGLINHAPTGHPYGSSSDLVVMLHFLYLMLMRTHKSHSYRSYVPTDFVGWEKRTHKSRPYRISSSKRDTGNWNADS
jgi:hypothetical protein